MMHSMRRARKPLDASRTGTRRITRVNQHTSQLMTCRFTDQPMVFPPGTFRDPIAMSNGISSGGVSAAIRRGISAGS